MDLHNNELSDRYSQVRFNMIAQHLTILSEDQANSDLTRSMVRHLMDSLWYHTSTLGDNVEEQLFAGL